jgi:hypothetical protein
MKWDSPPILKFKLWKLWFQILQIMENTMLAVYMRCLNIWIYVYKVFCHKKRFAFEKVNSNEIRCFANYGKHYAGGHLKRPPAVRHTAGGYHKSTVSIVVCQNLKIWNRGLKMFKILWNFQKLPYNIWIYVYEVFCYKKRFAFEKVSSNETLGSNNL